MPCEQPPAPQPPKYPSGAECRGAVEDRRACYKTLIEGWAVEMFGLYEREVDKRATEDRCLSELRRKRVIL